MLSTQKHSQMWQLVWPSLTKPSRMNPSSSRYGRLRNLTSIIRRWSRSNDGSTLSEKHKFSKPKRIRWCSKRCSLTTKNKRHWNKKLRNRGRSIESLKRNRPVNYKRTWMSSLTWTTKRRFFDRSWSQNSRNCSIKRSSCGSRMWFKITKCEHSSVRSEKNSSVLSRRRRILSSDRCSLATTWGTKNDWKKTTSGKCKVWRSRRMMKPCRYLSRRKFMVVFNLRSSQLISPRSCKLKTSALWR